MFSRMMVMVVNGWYAMAVVLGITGHVLSQCQPVMLNSNSHLNAQLKAVGRSEGKRDLVDLPNRDFFKRDNRTFEPIFLLRMPPKIKFSKKGRKKVHRTAEQSHKGQKNQQYDPKKWQEAFDLRKLNETMAPGDPKWTLDRIAEKTGIPKSTLGHRFNAEKTGERQGMGFIAGGSRKGRILGKGKQAR